MIASLLVRAQSLGPLGFALLIAVYAWHGSNGLITVYGVGGENWVMIDLLDFLEQAGYDVEKVLKFIGSKPPEFFDQVE